MWLAAFFAPVTPAVMYAEPPQKDYIGMVAAAAAYSSMSVAAPTPAPEPVKPKPVDPNCPTCKNSGRPGWVRTGDKINWTKCPTCQAPGAATSTAK